MTYRERRQARADRLRGWAASNEAKSEQRGKAADAILEHIPPGQPILVGHHSERRHRRDLNTVHRNIGASVELAAKAANQAARADEIDRQTDRAIYDDDPDAIERLSEKIAAMVQEREDMKAANATYRKDHKAELAAMTPYERGQAVPYPSYAISNLGGNIGRAKVRLARLRSEKENGPTDRTITARYDGECAECGTTITAGEMIRYNRTQGARCSPACFQEGEAAI